MCYCKGYRVFICLGVITNILLKLVEALIPSLISKTHGVLLLFHLVKEYICPVRPQALEGGSTPGALTLIKREPSLT